MAIKLNFEKMSQLRKYVHVTKKCITFEIYNFNFIIYFIILLNRIIF